MPKDEHERQRGSVLMLVPAAVLVLIILGAIAVDSALVFLGHREVAEAASAAANDAASAALDDAALYRDGAVAIDADRARRIAEAAVAARTPSGVTITGVAVKILDGNKVAVRVDGVVRMLFAPVVPGAQRSTDVHAVAIAEMVEVAPA